ncbi:hypothetical protein BK010_03645 [Tenericutes bacterium MO-XQ]|jgi:hypothetical protein|nr:hypothetical protein BK010_03645 [Tenericutes bacterium MO-XQ]
MEIKDILTLIATILIATGLVVFIASLIKVGFFRLFHFLPTKKLFIEYVLMHFFILIVVAILLIFIRIYDMPGVFRIVAPVYIAFSFFEAFYVYDKHLTYEPVTQYTFSTIISSILNIFLMSFLVFKTIYTILY